MVNRTDEALGRLAVAHGLVSEVELRGALDELTARGQAEVPGALGTYLVEQGSLTINQLERLMGAAAAAAMKVPKVGPYRLLEKLGAGGMGAVYRAERASDGQVVALKVLPRSKATDDEFLNRFEHEARAAFELSHPNIVKGLDMGQADGYHYIAMEFVDGRDLFSVLEERGKLPVDEALRLVIQIAGALEHAHTVRLVHRDIKPDNILIDRSGRAKLTDLGLVMEEAQAGGKPRITKRGLAMGTPFYFSPEQARGEEDIDTRSDIYALGATFYEMVTGKPPFEGESAAQVMLQHIQDQAANPRDIDRSLPDGLCRVIEKMMAKDREDRYQTPTELLGDLQLLAAGQEPKNADLKPWDATLRRAGGGRPPRSRSKLAPVNFSDVPLAPARATGRVRTVTGGRPRRTTRARRTTRERTTRERTAHGTAVPDRLPRWVVAMAVLLLAAACALAGFVVHRLTRDGKDRPGSAPANGTGGTPERSPGGPEKGIR